MGASVGLGPFGTGAVDDGDGGSVADGVLALVLGPVLALGVNVPPAGLLAAAAALGSAEEHDATVATASSDATTTRDRRIRVGTGDLVDLGGVGAVPHVEIP